MSRVILKLKFNYRVGKFERPRDLLGSHKKNVEEIKMFMEEVEDRLYFEAKLRVAQIMISCLIILIGLTLMIMGIGVIGGAVLGLGILTLVLRLWFFHVDNAECLKKLLGSKKWLDKFDEYNLKTKITDDKYSSYGGFDQNIMTIAFLAKSRNFSRMNTAEIIDVESQGEDNNNIVVRDSELVQVI